MNVNNLAYMEDISGGLEQMPIQCKPRFISSELSYPAKFRYVTRSIAGPDCEREIFEDQLCGCDCLHGCCQATCPCLKRFGSNYVPTAGQLTAESVDHPTQKPVIECNSQCACSSACPNRLVQHGVRVKLSVAPSGCKGFGLFACEDIKRLTFVCEYAGEVIGVSEAGRRLQRKDKDMNYVIVLREHCEAGVVLTCVDPQSMGNVGRFANHSCDPNLLMVPVRVDSSVPKLALFARRDIVAGEELSFDYSGEASLLGDSSSDGLPAGVSCCNSKGDDSALDLCRTNVMAEKNKISGVDLHNIRHTADGQEKDGDGQENKLKPESYRTDEYNGSQSAAVQCTPTVISKHWGPVTGGSDDIPHSDTAASSRDKEEGSPPTIPPNTRNIQHRKRKLPADTDDWVDEGNPPTIPPNTRNIQHRERKLPVDTDNWVDEGSLPTIPPNTRNIQHRKRKLPAETDDWVDDKPVEQGKQTSPLEARSAADSRKPCLCGSLCCKGFLPFDESIFDS